MTFDDLERNDVDGAMVIYRGLADQPPRVRRDMIAVLTRMQDDPTEFRARMAAEPLPDATTEEDASDDPMGDLLAEIDRGRDRA